MGFFKNDKRGNPPHIWYPEILHWEVGDEIRSIDYEKFENLSFVEKLMLRIDGFLEKEVIPINFYFYKGVTDKGFIIIEQKESKRLFKLSFQNFIKDALNLSFQERSIRQELNKSKEYMELIESFQQAYSELEESDKPKLLE